jgi:agmatine deiminase
MRRFSNTHLITNTICWLVMFATTAATARTDAQTIQTYMPDEAAPHEGTWLQWPHHYTYGATYRNRLDATWVAMTRALVSSEKVHIVAYNAAEKTRITTLLTAAKVPLTKVDFLLRQTNDCWARDGGPVFVYDNNDFLKITDWGFNGWGFDTPYTKDNTVPVGVASKVGVPRIDLNSTVLEGGAIEVDDNGVLMATRSSILEPNRNPGLTQAQLQTILTTNLGVTKFIWLNGQPGGQDDITDTHIDGFAKFAPSRTIVTMSNTDLAYWGLSSADIKTLSLATDINGTPYTFVRLPLTARDVVTTYGVNLYFKGSYVNYYVANTVVLVPTYNDPNDVLALAALQKLYPGRKVIGIDVRNLYAQGGMVHCVTQQQPVGWLGRVMNTAVQATSEK